MEILNMKRFKYLTAIAGLFLCLVICTVPVFAAPEKDPVSTEAATEASTEAVTEHATEAVTEAATEPATEKVTEPEAETPEKAKNKKAITPDGNLTMVDDIVSAVNGNKEFFTLYSKNGSCFYMIVDRDYEGEGNVYFLNMVDDSDLYALTGEKPAVTKPASETKPQTAAVSESPSADTGEKKLNVKNAVVAGAVILAIGGVVVIYFVKKKKGSKNQPDEFDMSEYGEDEDDE